LDHPGSDQELQQHHLQQAKDCGAFVLDFGDLFDAMQGKTDRRSNKQALKKVFAEMGDDDEARSYINALVVYAANFLEPYAGNIALIGNGNHESGVYNITEYDMVDGLLRDLHKSGYGHIHQAGYRGWIQVKFEHESGGARQGRNIYYHHGHGGGGPVTKDVIQANRKAVYLANADYVFTGHTHDQWLFPVERVRLTASGEEVSESQTHIKIPSYKQEFVGQRDGFHHETGKPPKPLGAWWVRFYWSNRTGRIEEQFIQAER
jgi:predicted phosphodiesterase